MEGGGGTLIFLYASKGEIIQRMKVLEVNFLNVSGDNHFEKLPLMHISMFTRRGGGGMGKGATFEHFCGSLSGEFDHKFCPTLRTFEFDRAEYWVLNSCQKRRHLR